jgi:MFS family permease
VSPSRGIAIATACIGIVCFGVLFIDNSHLLILLFVLRGGFSVAWTLFAAVLGDTVPWHLRGRSFAMAEFIGGIGFAVAPFVAGPLYGLNPKFPLILCALGTPILVALILLFERRVVRPAMALNLAVSPGAAT